jgi:AraC family ethanolamine operon transcriptional activator
MSSRKLQGQVKDEQIENQRILFPAGMKFSYSFDDPDEMTSYTAKWREEYFQISCGSFQGTLQVAHTRSLQIGRVTWSPSILIRGDPPEKSVVFAIPKNKTQPPVLHSDPLHTTELAMLREGDEIDFLSSCPQDMLVLSIDEDIINRYSITLLGEELDAIDSYNSRLKVKDESARIELMNVWERIINLALSSDNDLRDINFSKMIQEEMITTILCNTDPADTSASRAERHHAAKQARQYILENKNKQMSILAICEAVGATERTLHLGFKELYGLSPKAFMKYLRLNYARKNLLQAEPGCTVTHVAYKWKFYHLSRFARSYYEMFKEYPSETLTRSITL